MKKINLIIAIFLLSYGCYAQRKITLNSFSTLQLPNGTKTTTLDQAKLFVAEKFNNNSITLNSVASSKAENMYIVGNVLVTVYPQQQPVPKSQLNKLLEGFNAMNRKDKTYNAQISQLNNFSVLITNYHLENDVEYYRFFVSNNYNAPDVTGVLEFNPKDAAEGKQVLDNILANLKFKAQ